MSGGRISRRADDPSWAYWQDALAPFLDALAASDVMEILAQQEGCYWIERLGANALERITDARVTPERIARLARLVAGESGQEINLRHPLLSAALPIGPYCHGERIQFALPPAAIAGPALAIRKQVLRDLDLDAFAAASAAKKALIRSASGRDPAAEALAHLAKEGDPIAFLRAAIAARQTILIAGATSSGKTTFLNALLREIPATERLVTIEDAPELKPSQPNWLALIASRGDQGAAKLTMTDLVAAALRFRPDRLLIGELRGAEAFAFLRAINSGHPGALTTIHADSPDGAFEQLALLVLQAGLGLSRAEVVAYARTLIPIVVQLDRAGGGRRVREIFYAG
jgi:type IV secretion system protein VirB11